jgi:hypothetical protein
MGSLYFFKINNSLKLFEEFSKYKPIRNKNSNDDFYKSYCNTNAFFKHFVFG